MFIDFSAILMIKCKHYLDTEVVAIERKQVVLETGKKNIKTAERILKPALWKPRFRWEFN
jgi:hypothetical protein